MALKVNETGSARMGFIPEKTPAETPDAPVDSMPTADIDAIGLIENHNINFNRGQVIRLMATAGVWNKYQVLEDLTMARWYLDREIARLQKAPQGEKVDSTKTGKE